MNPRHHRTGTHSDPLFRDRHCHQPSRAVAFQALGIPSPVLWGRRRQPGSCCLSRLATTFKNFKRLIALGEGKDKTFLSCFPPFPRFAFAHSPSSEAFPPSAGVVRQVRLLSHRSLVQHLSWHCCRKVQRRSPKSLDSLIVQPDRRPIPRATPTLPDCPRNPCAAQPLVRLVDRLLERQSVAQPRGQCTSAFSLPEPLRH